VWHQLEQARGLTVPDTPAQRDWPNQLRELSQSMIFDSTE
jgi:hypothetical protein